MAYKTENGYCKITCDKCGTTDTATENNAGNVFFNLGWGLFPNAKKYQHLCIACIPKKYKNLMKC